jgi:hypothetical protein
MSNGAVAKVLGITIATWEEAVEAFVKKGTEP